MAFAAYFHSRTSGIARAGFCGLPLSRASRRSRAGSGENGQWNIVLDIRWVHYSRPTQREICQPCASRKSSRRSDSSGARDRFLWKAGLNPIAGVIVRDCATRRALGSSPNTVGVGEGQNRNGWRPFPDSNSMRLPCSRQRLAELAHLESSISKNAGSDYLHKG